MSRLDQHICIPNDFMNFDETEGRLAELVDSRGVGFVQGLEGIFGHVYESGGKIKAFTDWIGQYPLYFLIIRDRGGGLQKAVFANHIAAFLSYPGYAYENVYRVPPSHLVVIDSATGDIEYQRYYRLPRYGEDEVRAKVGRDLEEIGANYRRILYEEVEKRLPPKGTPIGVALGGIDSLQVLKVLVDLRPDDLIVYNIKGEDTPRNRKVAHAFNLQLKEICLPRDQLLKEGHKLLDDILDHIEDFDPIGAYAGVSCSLIFDIVRKDNISVVATGSGGNAWSGMYIRDRWFQISEENLLDVSVRRRLIMGYPPDSGFYRPHQQLGGGWSRELGSHDLKLASEFGIRKLIEPHLSRPVMEFGVNIPAHYCKFTKDAIQASYSGRIRQRLLEDLDHFHQNQNGQYIIARFPIVYSAFKADLPDELFITGGARLYDSIGIAALLDSLGGEEFLVNRFNAKFRANEVKRQSVR